MKLLVIVAAVVGLVYGASLENDSVEGSWENVEFTLQASEPFEGEEDQVLPEDIALYNEAINRNFVEGRLRELLESFRGVVINGHQSIPPLDPLKIDSVGPYRLPVSVVRATVTLSKGSLVGLSKYTVDEVKFNILTMRLRLQLTVPKLSLNAKYSVRSRLAFITLHKASGNVRFDLRNLAVAVNTRLGTSFIGGYMYLRDLEINVSASRSYVRMTGMTGSRVLNLIISNILNGFSDSIVDSVFETVSEQLSIELLDAINEVLRESKMFSALE